jgi:hypothetical protein
LSFGSCCDDGESDRDLVLLGPFTRFGRGSGVGSGLGIRLGVVDGRFGVAVGGCSVGERLGWFGFGCSRHI